MRYKITISFTDQGSGEEIVHHEHVEAQNEAELEHLVPKLLMTLSRTGFIRYNAADGWLLIPGVQLGNLRARLSRIIVTDSLSMVHA